MRFVIGSGAIKKILTMIHIPITNLFNVYDLQINPFDEEKIGLQDVVNYCEARFRVALQAIMKRSEKDQKHMYKLLWGEMVCVCFIQAFRWTLMLLLSGIMFHLHWCGGCDQPTTQDPSHCQVTRARHVPSWHDSRQVILTWPGAHDLLGWKSQQQWT